MSLPLHSVLVLRENDDPEYAYGEVEIVGAHRITEHETELVLASTKHFAPNFTVAESMLNRAGYELDIEASKALALKRAKAAEAEAAARVATIPALPWEVEA